MLERLPAEVAHALRGVRAGYAKIFSKGGLWLSIGRSAVFNLPRLAGAIRRGRPECRPIAKLPTHDGEGAGNLYATLRVVIGPPDDALKAFLEGWAPEHRFDPRRAMEPQP